MNNADTIRIDTEDQWEEWMGDAGEPYYFAQQGGLPWIVYCNEDGDWYATRPASDDDRREDGTYPPGVTIDAEGLAPPLCITPSQGLWVLTVDDYQEPDDVIPPSAPHVAP